MSALPVQRIFEALHDAGLSISLAPDGGLGVAPASRLTHELRKLIRTNKVVLVNWLHAANDPAAAKSHVAEKPNPDRWCWPHNSAMTDWMARERAEIPGLGQGRTAKTEKPPLSSIGVGGIFENKRIAVALMDAAMKVCDAHNDNEFAREEMRQDILGIPPHLRQDLLDHFTGKPVN